MSAKVVDTQQQRRVEWRNGLGSSLDIAQYPSDQDEFIWKLSEQTLNGNASLPVFPDYDIALLPLSESQQQTIENEHEMMPKATLYHNDSEAGVTIEPNTPYTYKGEWPTALKLKRPCKSIKLLSLWINRNSAHMSLNVESVVSHGTVAELTESVEKFKGVSELSDGSENEGEFTSLPPPWIEAPRSPDRRAGSSSTRIILGTFTLIYVINGCITVSVSGNERPFSLTPGQLLIVEKPMDEASLDLSITPVDQESALIYFVQINMKPLEPKSPRDSRYRLTRTRTGSVVMFDESPMQDLPLDHFGGSQIDLDYQSAKHYTPPSIDATWRGEADVPPAVIRDSLVINEFPRGKISTAWINMVKQGLSEWVRIPAIIARGLVDGSPILGITAAMHGNELNGVPCIHKVISSIDMNLLVGTVVAIPCVNVPGYLRHSREYADGKDLNRLFPGKESGTASQVYAYNFFHKIVRRFEFLIDLHTASFGRVNSYYVRVDMNDPIAALFAKLQQPQIILHNSGHDGTLRSACMSQGIKCITIEIGNPHIFQSQFVQWSYIGLMRIMNSLKMLPSESLIDKVPLHPSPTTILCSKGFWIYTKTGGVLQVFPSVNTIVKKGMLIAHIRNIFGNIIDQIHSPCTAIVIGKSSNPVAATGDRIIHLGIIKRTDDSFAKEAKENY